MSTKPQSEISWSIPSDLPELRARICTPTVSRGIIALLKLSDVAVLIYHETMAHAQSVLGIIRAVRPQFRSKHDRLAFAAHALMLASGYKAVAVGEAAEALDKIEASAPEVGAENWAEKDESYAFAYTDAAGNRSPVLVKALPIGNKLLVHILSQNANSAPETLELDTDKFTAADAGLIEGYKNVEALVSDLANALKKSATPVHEANKTSSAAQPSSSATADFSVQQPSGKNNMPPGMPGCVVGIPGITGGPELPTGISPGFPGAFPDGMHVGPQDPMFQGSSCARPGFGLPQGPFPGVRFDPANPAGLEPECRDTPVDGDLIRKNQSCSSAPDDNSSPSGVARGVLQLLLLQPPANSCSEASWLQGFNASDFQRDRSTHPDLAPPGGGRCPTFDSMFG